MQCVQFFRHSVLSLLCCALMLAGCGDQDSQNSQDMPAVKTTLSIGLIPEHNIFRQKERYQPLANYLKDQAGIAIELKVLPRYGNIVTNFINAKLDGAFLGSFTFALIHSRLKVVPLARPETTAGVSSYHGMIFVRKDSGISTGQDMKGKSFAFVDKATTAGYLLPLHYFQTQGIKDYHTWFAETYFTGSHGGAVYDVLNKKADIGAAKDTVFYRLAQTDKRILDELRILSESPDVPENGLALRHDLDPILILQIKNALLDMNNSRKGKIVLKEMGMAKFIETFPEDYSPVYEYAKSIGIDLSTYDYLND